MTIVEFLNARLDEEAESHRRVHQPYRLYACDDGHIEEPVRVEDLYGEHDGEYEQWTDGDDRLPNHHNSWALVYDPARVLREVEAKRAIAALHWPKPWPKPLGNGIDCVGCREPVGRDGACTTLRLLAAPFSDHPDYDPSWSST